METLQQHLTREQYLAIDDASPNKHQFYQGEIFNNYRSIPSLQDYLLVDSEKVHIEHFQRQNDTQWLLSEYWQPEDRLTLMSVGLEVTLQTIYQGTKFPEQ